MEGTNDVTFEELDGEKASGPGWAEVTGLGKNPRYKRHEYVSALLREALHRLPKDAGAGPFEIKTTVYVGHSSPGWWDGFRVSAT